MAAMERRGRRLLQWQLPDALTPISEAPSPKGPPFSQERQGLETKYAGPSKHTPQTYEDTRGPNESSCLDPEEAILVVPHSSRWSSSLAPSPLRG